MAFSIIGSEFYYGKRVTLWDLRKVLPPAKWYKIKCRPKEFAVLYAKTDTGITEYYIKKLDNGIFELVEVGSNERKVAENEST